MKRSEIITALFDTMDVAKRSMQSQIQNVVAEYDVTRTQMEVLFTIHHSGHENPITSRQLAKTLQLTPGAISQQLDELEKRSFISRTMDPEDRRRHIIEISTNGHHILKTMSKRRRELMEEVISELSDAELTTWLKIQRNLVHAFKKHDTK